MRFRLALSSRPVGLGLLAPCLLALGACRSDAPDDGPPPLAPPDVVRSAFQGTPTLPTVVTFTPTGMALGVSTKTDISADFSVELQPASTTSAITVSAAGAAVQGTHSYDPALKRITFSPAAELPPSSTIAVTLADTIAQDGTPCPGMQWEFTTAP